jgi:transmembrane sensor
MTERRLARYVPVHLSEARVARQWGEVEKRSQPSDVSRRFVHAFVLGVILALSVVLIVRMRQRLTSGSIEGAVLQGGEVMLPDGSQIVVETGGQVRIAAVRADCVELGLVAGALNLTVPHGSRRLLVHAGAYDVVDLGTRFRVALGAGGEVNVEVVEGSVEIEGHMHREPALRLTAGNKWSSEPPAASVKPRDEPGAATNPMAGEDAPPNPSPAPTSMPGARELLETAEHARLAGRPQAAATALDMLRRHYRHDPRAALAAFELGRLRLDTLRDAPGAVEALTDAISLAPRGPLREDAEARRVEALAAERSPECATARDAFLERYPHGVHRALVAGQCGAD